MNIIIPMAGLGSRFMKSGITTPKPLVQLKGRPFFWWSAKSLLRYYPNSRLIFVVQQQHVESFKIDQEITRYFPNGIVEVTPVLTRGALETCMIGLERVENSNPIVFMDSDLAFKCSEMTTIAKRLKTIDCLAGLLCTFESNRDCYSYAEFRDYRLVRTKEKMVISDTAIAGCYVFKNADIVRTAYDSYRVTCEYDELFTSGLFNTITAAGGLVEQIKLDAIYSFGTPDEFHSVERFIPNFDDF